MRPRNFWFITLLVLCHSQVRGQMLTNALPPAQQSASSAAERTSGSDLPDDPGQEVLPTAQPEQAPTATVPVRWQAHQQARHGSRWTLDGEVAVYYQSYTLRADHVVYDESTSELEADGHLQLTGGPEDIVVTASRGDMRLNMHTARLFDVDGSLGVRHSGNVELYSTTNPFLFSGRVLLQTAEGRYRIIDGKMTNCRLPRPDWQLIAHSIRLEDGEASTANTYLRLFSVPIFYLPYLRHPVSDTGRQSGLLIPIISNGSSIRGYTFGEQVYFVLNRSMDMIIGSEYYSKRGFAPNGDFRYKGTGLDHVTIRWNALLDRGVAATPPATEKVNQGGIDIAAEGRKDFGDNTRLAGNVEYLSRYVYRLVFNETYSQAVNSQVRSTLGLTRNINGFIPSGWFGRQQNFASSATGDEARILHLPGLRFDVLDRPLGASHVYWGMDSSMGYLGRSEPDFHARNIGRLDVYPHVALPLESSGWLLVPEVAFRETFYTGSQTPDLAGTKNGTPTLQHDPLNRTSVQVSVDLRPPAVERDFTLTRWGRQLRHVIEPEFTYRYETGISTSAQNVLLVDTADIATDTNEIGFSLTQRFYLKPLHAQPCAEGEECPAQQREWASWQIAQKVFLNADFGGSLLTGRRNVNSSTLDLTGVSFLTEPRNLAPIISRLRFEAVQNLRIEWDLDYDPRKGRLGADNLYAGYSWGRTTVGIGHTLLNAVDEEGTTATTIQSQQIQPFIQIGKPSAVGFNIAANGGYDFVHGALQYAGIQAVYNWDCCGLTVGYRRFELGKGNTASRDETEWLYSFTLANFGSVGDIRRSNAVFRDPSQPPLY
ncbi:MAG: LPS assembly protein LptD [Terracidiphilus sp.]|nr:LPS assembly protein LptD [Terracidiphilus sp.]